MTVSSTVSRSDYIGNDATATYSYLFKILAQGDLKVTVRLISSGLETTLALTTDYTVTGVNAAAGGTIVLVNASQAWLTGGFLKSTYALTIRRVMTLTQPTDIRNQGSFFPETHEDEFDRLLMQIQTKTDETDRSIKLPETEVPTALLTTLPIAALRASKFLAFDTSGNPIAATAVTGTPVTAAAATILDDATIDAIRATLGVNGWAGSAGGTADALTLTPTPALAAYVAGDPFAFLATATNTGAATVAVSGLAAKSVRNLAGVALVAGEITSGRLYVMRYDGTNFRLHDILALSSGSVTAQTINVTAMGFSMLNGTLTATIAANALTVAIKTKAGTDPSATDPVLVLFRNATAATGDYSLITLTAATSFVVSSGSTLGATSATAFRLWIVGFNDGGTFRLGAINALSGTNIYPLGQFPLASSTAEGGAGAADSAQVFYTGMAVTSKAYTILGYASYESGLTTAGTWDATPTRLHLQAQSDPLPGAVIQMVGNTSGAVATGTTAIPKDDTIPQITEGDQYLTQAVTPTSASNLLRILGQLFFRGTVDTRAGVLALFRDATANALSVATHAREASTTGVGEAANIDHSVLAASAASTTFRLRAGDSNGATTTVNGEAGVRQYGGVYNSYLNVEEILA